MCIQYLCIMYVFSVCVCVCVCVHKRMCCMLAQKCECVLRLCVCDVPIEFLT